MKKIVCPGNGEYGPVYCNIKIEDGNLSITGVEGPKSNGDCCGGAGQIHPVEGIEKFSDGWDADLLARFNEVWERWHLNDMRPGCEHQRESGASEKQIEVVTYGLTREAHSLRREAQDEAFAAARDGRVANLTEAGQFLIGPDWYKDRHSPPDADSPLSGLYEVKKRETKRAGWVLPSEHPDGQLTRPCGVCGYKYGSAWLHEELPDDVVRFLESLPDSLLTPAWV